MGLRHFHGDRLIIMTSLARPSGHRPPLTRAAAQRLFPETPLEVIDALATIWDEFVHRIIDEMMELTRIDQVPLHINLREEMVLELAQLQLWLGEGVINKRMTGRDLSACFGSSCGRALRRIKTAVFFGKPCSSSRSAVKSAKASYSENHTSTPLPGASALKNA
jgi:hypothetical protein